MADKKLTKFAFWQYDQLPYIVGTETDGKRNKDGTVSVPSYGVSAGVKPIKLMGAEEGRVLLNQVRQLNAMRESACVAAFRLFKHDAIEAAPFMRKLFRDGD